MASRALQDRRKAERPAKGGSGHSYGWHSISAAACRTGSKAARVVLAALRAAGPGKPGPYEYTAARSRFSPIMARGRGGSEPGLPLSARDPPHAAVLDRLAVLAQLDQMGEQ